MKMYSRTPSDLRKVSDISSSERPRSSWESSFSQPHRSYHHPPHRSPTTRDTMDPESSDSDVSQGGGDEYRFANPLTAPVPLPPQPSKHALESSDAVQARLDELQRVEEHNIKKYDLLKAKRTRKDDKIRRKRDIQDKKWAAILESRQRRDHRISVRRKREDAAFSQFFDHELEEEEGNLRRRLKRLKRGLPPDESPQPGAARISSASMSPPGPALSTIPPPAKRHQVGPPGQPDAINTSQSRPSEQKTIPPVKTTGPSPTYPYYRDQAPAYNRPFHHSGNYSTTPSTSSPTTNTNGINHHAQASSDRSYLSHFPRPGSPRSRPASSAQSPATPVTASVQPPRVTSSSYDTKPPPTTSSTGFAPINAPSSSGFATINPRNTATPPMSHAGPVRPLQEVENKTPVQPLGSNGADSNRFHSYTSTPTATPTLTANTASKRTPSTTHPYQMSEAFANRHHHCERVDGLNRGIWTSYGVGGTQENPTGPVTEMYLRCNHDGCSRIDWRTVHGLQCHIVKNHEQPKGTIGSLDKALEKYGVLVKEVEDYETEHGRGTAGTVADPKNHKIKIKTKEALHTRPYSRTGTPGSYGIDPQTRPAGYRPSPTSTTGDSPTLSDEIKRSPVTGFTNGPAGVSTASAPSPAPPRQPPPPSASPSINTFSSLTGTHIRSDFRSDWLGRPILMQTPQRYEPEPKSLQGDFGASNGSSTAQPVKQSPIQPSVVDARTQPTSSPALNSTAPAAVPQPAVSEPGRLPPVSVNATPSAPSIAPVSTAPTVIETPTVSKEIQQIEPKQEKEEINAVKQGPPPSHSVDTDTPMSGTDQPQPEAVIAKVNGAVDGEKVESQVQSVEDHSEDQSETIVVDGEANKGLNDPARKSTLHSPTITNKTITTTTPGSMRRPSRRSSAARKSVDVDAEAAYLRDVRSSTVNTNGENDDKDEKDSKDERDKTPQRRFPSGRVLRRGRV